MTRKASEIERGKEGMAFADCLVDGSRVTGSRRRSRSAAWGISALIQIAAVAALLVVPLFAGVGRLVIPQMVVVPPYGAPPKALPPAGRRLNANNDSRKPVLIDELPTTPQIMAPNKVPHDISDSDGAKGEVDANTAGTRWGAADNSSTGLISIYDNRESTPLPRPPVTGRPVPAKPVSVSEGAEMAMLIRRVEPVYPLIAKQIHLEGTVELYAIISRDGTIEKLEVLSGNPVLAQAARDAVMQWRFRPAILNREPIEVDTYITVKFNINQ
jgi:periplasmic protein TonB